MRTLAEIKNRLDNSGWGVEINLLNWVLCDGKLKPEQGVKDLLKKTIKAIESEETICLISRQKLQVLEWVLGKEGMV